MTKIGLRNARVLCNMAYNERVSFIAEGLPILLASARSSWSAAESLAAMPRESQVLMGLADEEAAKLLILIDIVRCPKEVIASRIGPMTTWFYDHLARLLYSEAQSWRPSNVKELQGYLDNERKAHYLEGDAGEYIMQNWSVYNRESAIYADISQGDDAPPTWHNPVEGIVDLPYVASKALGVAEALSALGLLTPKGLGILADVWGGTDFKDTEIGSDSDRLIAATIKRCIDEGTPTEDAEQEHVRRLYMNWQLPMYHLDFKLLPVSLEEMRRQQQANLWSEYGDH